MRRSIRTIRSAIDGAGNTDGLREQLNSTFGMIDRIASKGIIHSNTASRYKSRLTKRFQSLLTQNGVSEASST